MAFLFIAFGIAAIWLIILSLFGLRLYNHYNSLTSKTKGKELIKILDDIVKNQSGQDTQISQLKKEFARLDKDGEFHLQRVGLVRFNPFNETGGDQSFSLSLLDAHGTGFVLTGLHTRDRTRVYTKPIEKGKSRYELSAEEKKAIKQALK